MQYGEGKGGSNSGQFPYPLPNTVHPLDTVEGSVRTGAGNCPEFGGDAIIIKQDVTILFLR